MSNSAVNPAWFETFLDNGWIPDQVLRGAIRRLCAGRLRSESARSASLKMAFLDSMRQGPIAIDTQAANRQHYEVPPEFFRIVLGPRLKYSCCYWPDRVATLARAEEAALDQIVQRARIQDGQRILELGCGWGSLSLYLAERFPNARVTGVSNSAAQKRWIDGEKSKRGLTNLRIITADMNTFAPDEPAYDRVVSIEMFEHMRNWLRLFERIGEWAAPDAAVFLHIFSHREFAYPFEDERGSDWMARHFFSGGLMPSDDLVAEFSDGWHAAEQWVVGGEHYSRTSEAWLAQLDRNLEQACQVFTPTRGATEARRIVRRWRVFFMACAELFGYADGSEWRVMHYRLER